ncbi:MAG: hypothetical protein ACHBMF_08620 [Chromatiales bacterium]
MAVAPKRAAKRATSADRKHDYRVLVLQGDVASERAEQRLPIVRQRRWIDHDGNLT